MTITTSVALAPWNHPVTRSPAWSKQVHRDEFQMVFDGDVASYPDREMDEFLSRWDLPNFGQDMEGNFTLKTEDTDPREREKFRELEAVIICMERYRIRYSGAYDPQSQNSNTVECVGLRNEGIGRPGGICERRGGNNRFEAVCPHAKWNLQPDGKMRSECKDRLLIFAKTEEFAMPVCIELSGMNVGPMNRYRRRLDVKGLNLSQVVTKLRFGKNDKGYMVIKPVETGVVDISDPEVHNGMNWCRQMIGEMLRYHHLQAVQEDENEWDDDDEGPNGNVVEGTARPVQERATVKEVIEEIEAADDNTVVDIETGEIRQMTAREKMRRRKEGQA